MARTTTARQRIYRETVDQVLSKYRLSKSEFCKQMDHSQSWYATTFGKGFYDITKASLRLWSVVIGCTEDELTAIPVNPQGKQKQKEAEAKTADADTVAMIANLTATMVDGFAMLHQDIQMLIETMHKYWRSEEPKYEVKEREQP
jgi:hypothetical protein